MSSYSEGDKVVVNNRYEGRKGQTGVVVKQITDAQHDDAYLVRLDDGPEKGFFGSELDPVDPTEKKLIALAESFEAARILANDIESAAHTHGPYGYASQGLWHTLNLILGGSRDETETCYSAIVFDGLTVPQGIKHVRGY